jgi:hypothetical protein
MPQMPQPPQMPQVTQPEAPIQNNEDLPENLQNVLKDLVRQYEHEDSWVRKQQLKLWKKNEEFWHGIQFIFWSESRQDWVSPAETKWTGQEEGREEAEGPFYDFVINIYKAHGESVIAALSAEVPSVRFPPDDAEDEDDLVTSKTYDKIADLIQRHNNAKMTLLQALFTLWNQGMVCAYHAPKADKAFGVVEIPQYTRSKFCEFCSKPVAEPMSESVPPSQDQMTGAAPPVQSPPGPTMPGAQPQVPQESCPDCGMPVTERPVITGYSESPKTRVVWELYGPIFVQVPFYARDQKECGYLLLKKDFPVALLQNLYPHMEDKLEHDTAEDAEYERFTRSPSTFSSYSRIDERRNLRALKRIWFRPWVLDGLSKEFESEKQQLKEMFPDGIYCAFIGDNYVESRNEDVDKYWTVGKCGLSTFIHCDPLGQPLISVQELRNVLVNLVQETIEHGIPSTFADTEVLDFDTYSRHEARPGMVFPVVRKPGEAIADAFYESSRATVSKELGAVWKQLDQDGQFAVGSFPSIYGGPSEGKTRTASEYNSSRQMALQRLSISWSYVVQWWTKLIEKSVHLFVENVVADEKYVIKENNNYINIWIRQAEMTGKVGDVEPEGSEMFPTTIMQKQDLFMKLLGLNDDMIKSVLFDPENRRMIADILGDPNLYVPGEDQRIKQAREIQMMIKTSQVVPIETAVDDDDVHIGALKNFMVGAVGLDLKMTNPQAYQALTQHLQMHQQNQMMQQMQQMQAQGPGDGQPQPQETPNG